MVVLDVCKALDERYKSWDEAIRKGLPLDRELLYHGWAWPVAKGKVGMANTNAVDKAQLQIANDDANAPIWFTTTLFNEDRDGDIVVPKGVETASFKDNPVIFFGHQEFVIPIAKGVDNQGRLMWIAEENRCRGGALFDTHDEDAMFIRGKVLRGYLSACSIAFVPVKAFKRGHEEFHKAQPRNEGDGKPLGWVFEQVELTEWSVVGVPANAGALRDSRDSEKSFISPRLYKALTPYCATAKGNGCVGGFCPCPEPVCAPCEKSLPKVVTKGATPISSLTAGAPERGPADFKLKPKMLGYGKFMVTTRGLVKTVERVHPNGKVIVDGGGAAESADGMLYDNQREALQAADRLKKKRLLYGVVTKEPCKRGQNAKRDGCTPASSSSKKPVASGSDKPATKKPASKPASKPSDTSTAGGSGTSSSAATSSGPTASSSSAGGKKPGARPSKKPADTGLSVTPSSFFANKISDLNGGGKVSPQDFGLLKKNVNNLTVANLKDGLKALGVKGTGTKAVLSSQMADALAKKELEQHPPPPAKVPTTPQQVVQAEAKAATSIGHTNPAPSPALTSQFKDRPSVLGRMAKVAGRALFEVARGGAVAFTAVTNPVLTPLVASVLYPRQTAFLLGTVGYAAMSALEGKALAGEVRKAGDNAGKFSKDDEYTVEDVETFLQDRMTQLGDSDPKQTEFIQSLLDDPDALDAFCQTMQDQETESMEPGDKMSKKGMISKVKEINKQTMPKFVTINGIRYKSTSSDVRSPTETSTSTEAYTADNFTATVTGGAGEGNTTVNIYLTYPNDPDGGDERESAIKVAEKKLATIEAGGGDKSQLGQLRQQISDLKDPSKPLVGTSSVGVSKTMKNHHCNGCSKSAPCGKCKKTKAVRKALGECSGTAGGYLANKEEDEDNMRNKAGNQAMVFNVSSSRLSSFKNAAQTMGVKITNTLPGQGGNTEVTVAGKPDWVESLAQQYATKSHRGKPLVKYLQRRKTGNRALEITVPRSRVAAFRNAATSSTTAGMKCRITNEQKLPDGDMTFTLAGPADYVEHLDLVYGKSLDHQRRKGDEPPPDEEVQMDEDQDQEVEMDLDQDAEEPGMEKSAPPMAHYHANMAQHHQNALDYGEQVKGELESAKSEMEPEHHAVVDDHIKAIDDHMSAVNDLKTKHEETFAERYPDHDMKSIAGNDPQSGDSPGLEGEDGYTEMDENPDEEVEMEEDEDPDQEVEMGLTGGEGGTDNLNREEGEGDPDEFAADSELNPEDTTDEATEEILDRYRSQPKGKSKKVVRRKANAKSIHRQVRKGTDCSMTEHHERGVGKGWLVQKEPKENELLVGGQFYEARYRSSGWVILDKKTGKVVKTFPVDSTNSFTVQRQFHKLEEQAEAMNGPQPGMRNRSSSGQVRKGADCSMAEHHEVLRSLAEGEDDPVKRAALHRAADTAKGMADDEMAGGQVEMDDGDMLMADLDEEDQLRKSDTVDELDPHNVQADLDSEDQMRKEEEMGLRDEAEMVKRKKSNGTVKTLPPRLERSAGKLFNALDRLLEN